MGATNRKAETLARRFLAMLRGHATAPARHPETYPRDAIVEALSLDDELTVPPAREVPVELAAAAIMLARAVAGLAGFARALNRAGPVVSVEVPGREWVAPIELAFTACLLRKGRLVLDGDKAGRRTRNRDPRTVVAFVRDGSDTKHRPDIGNELVGDAVQAGWAVLGIAGSAAGTLPRDLMRAADFRIEVGPPDPTGIALTIEALTGALPARAIDPGLAMLCEPSDLRLSIAATRGPDGSLDRLETLLRGKRGTPGGPRLEEFRGLGEARAWGLALARDLRRWRSGDGSVAFADCESALLLSGPPGCGKTRFAAALALSTGLELHAGSLGQWQAARDGHLGHTLGAMRAFFEKARRAPCIALIDEIDSFGSRETFQESHRNYSSQCVNALLEHLDGSASREGIVVIATTNHPDRIDPAILRSGRIDRHIRIGPPGLDDLCGILRHYLGDALPDLDLAALAARARGMTGADAEGLVRRARGIARRDERHLVPADLVETLAEMRPPMNEALRVRASVHEAGHGLAAVASGATGRVTLSIASAGGVTELGASTVPGSGTEADFDDALVLLLAGRAAESVVLGEVSAGSVGDLAEATRLAAEMESRWGFSARFPLVSLGLGEAPDVLRAPWLMEPLQERLDRAYARALELMERERVALVRVSEALFHRQHLDDAEVRALASGPVGRTG